MRQSSKCCFPAALVLMFCCLLGVAEQTRVFSWIESPVIVGGTQGSGTRGVEQALIDLGIYMHPQKSTELYKACYNNKPMDNMCMNSHSPAQYGQSINSRDSRSSYWKWLNNETCVPPTFQSFEDNDGGKVYIASIPTANKKPHRWGWKLPENMFNINLYAAKYPNFIFVHVLRNPLDMASSWTQHLASVTNEFASLHGGPKKAAAVMEERCVPFVASWRVGTNATTAPATTVSVGDALKFVRSMRDCAVSPLALEKMANFGVCFSDPLACTPDLTPPPAWSCLHMMLWAEMNQAVHKFGQNCLAPTNRYLEWHSADNYVLRGQADLRNLEAKVSDVLGFELEAVKSMFHAMAATSSHSRALRQGRRRLAFGKYLSTPDFNVDQAIHCAEAAEPGTLVLFGYPSSSY